MTAWISRPIRKTLAMMRQGLLLALVAVLLTGAETALAADEAGGTTRLRALLKPRLVTGLSAEIGARITEMAARPGGRFRKGDTLVRFDCALQRAQLRKAEAELTAARKTLAVKRELAKFNSASVLEVEVAEATSSRAEAEVAMANAVVSHCAIRAPFDGRVVEVRVQAFEGTSPGQKLMDVIDDGELEVEAIVPSHWLSWVKAGTSFRVRIDETGRDYEAVVRRLGAQVDPVSQSVKIYGAIRGKAPDLIAGMSGEVTFPQAPP